MNSSFIKYWNKIANKSNRIALEHGWDATYQNESELLMLVVSELSEGLEWLRKGNLKSDHISNFLGIEEELADVIIRIMNMGKSKGWRIAEAVIGKLNYNENRPFKHEGKRF